MTKIINLFAGPGAGKSTTASKLFASFKDHAEQCELVTEFAKDLAYSNPEALKCPSYVWGVQTWRIQRLIGKVDYIITDCPTLLCAAYTDNIILRRAIHGDFQARSSDNINFFLNRTKPFATYGRVHDEEQSKKLDDDIRNMLGDYEFQETTGDNDGVKFIMEYILAK